LVTGLGSPIADRFAYGMAESAPTATALSASAATSVYGQSVTFTAAVTSAGSPVTSGSVTFTDGTTALGTVSVDGSGRAAFTTSRLSAGGGPHVVRASYSPSGLYLTSFDTASLTVSPAPLTVSADGKAKVYGQPNPALTASYSGFVNGDTAAVVSGLTLSTTATTASGAGSYAITAAGATAANYTISYVAGTLLVTPAPLTITADDQGKVAGDPVPALTASYGGFVNGDTPAGLTTPVTLTTYTGDAAGSYPIVAAGASSPNYAITFVNGTLTVTPASTDPAAPVLGGHTFTAADAGAYTFTAAQLFTAGARSLSASDGTLSGGAGVTVSPTAAAALVLSAPSSATAGAAFAVTVTA
jgi:hypothetical protein